ncbi:uncharacterized protein LOC103042293 [Astyanax mexicanus]|uniref:uncharacterized protein LOC103042293 n=1 Tax=Astyanax mexicanus TaxID=7994 RepID=UPI0020CB3040|nr:uncharacterized protein LOC103042293 [Astyanax mexicanus]
MSCEVKASLLNILLLSATALGSAETGNRSLEEPAELDLGSRAEPRGEGGYLRVNGGGEGGESGGGSEEQMQTNNYTTINYTSNNYTTNNNTTNNNSSAQPVWTSVEDEVPHPRRKVFSSKPPQPDLRVLQKHQTISQPLHSADQSKSLQWSSGGEDRPQSDSPGYEAAEDFITQQWFGMRPSVQCSGGGLTFTAQGRGYTHLFVERVDAAPVHVLQLFPDCGYFVRATWRDLLLTASFDACYILKENDSYVLPLLWWGRRVKISCSMIPDSPLAPSGFCSDSGLAIMMEGDQVAVEKFKVKASREWVPFLSDTCACRVESPPEYVMFFISFTAPCIKDSGGTVHILLNRKEYTLSCKDSPSSSQQPLHPGPTQAQPTTEKATQHTPPYQPYPKPNVLQLPFGFDPIHFPNPYLMDPHLPGEVPNLQHSYSDVMSLSELAALGGAPGTHSQQHLPVSLIPQPPGPPGIPAASYPKFPTFSPPVGQYHPVLGPVMDYQLPDAFPYPIQDHLKPPRPLPRPDDHEVQVQQRLDLTSQLGVNPNSVQKAPPSKLPVSPFTQEAKVVQHSSRDPVLPTASSEMEPSLSCKGSHLVADLPSAKMDSVKVKDVTKKNTWLPVASAPVHCGYSLQRKDRGVVFTSPLPTCHSRTLSSSLLALWLKFWDIVQLRHRVLQLRCHSAEPPAPAPTTAVADVPWTRVTASLVPEPKPEPSYSQTAKPPPQPKPTASSQQARITMEPSWGAKTTPQPLVPHIQCLYQHMNVTLPYQSVTGLTVQIPSRGDEENLNAVLLNEAPVHCGYLVKEDHNGFINVILPYTSCHMAYRDGQYKITLAYRLEDGNGVEALLSCKPPKGQECNLPAELQLDCGPSTILAEDCHALGCCYSSDNGVCYYPMDECTADRHFVFSIPSSLTDPPLSPTLLSAAGNSTCIPQRVVGDSALFKIPLDDCGAHRYEVGKTVIYLLEILNTLQSLSQNYGTITRDSPIRLLVECRYLPGTLASVSYLVKSPSLGPSVQAQGVFGVQLRIAKDQHYSSYYPQYHRPLKKLLGKPLYLEVRLLNAPDPSVVLLVHYCVAYPRSAHSAWILIYDGCPNPLDVTPTNNPPPSPPEAVANHVRRFTISTFQFLDPNKDQLEPSEKQEEEEIYFMCATEVCLPSEGPCVEGCFENALTTKS